MNTLKQLIQWIKQNRDYVLLLAVFSVIVVLILSILFRKETPERMAYPAPFSAEQSGEHLWGNVKVSEDDVESGRTVPVYHASEFDRDMRDAIVSKLGFSGVTEERSGDGVYYLWTRGESFVRYNTVRKELDYNGDPILLPALGRVTLTADTAGAYFEHFSEEILGISSSFSTNVTQAGSSFTVSASPLLGDIRVVNGGNREYPIIAQFSEDGDLLSLSAQLSTFRDTGDTVGLVPGDDLAEYIRTQSYPKEAFLDSISSGDPLCETSDPYGLYSLDSFTDAVISDIEVVYYYDPLAGADVLPVYRMVGSGTVVDEESVTHPVSVVIYANAVEPSRIVLPSDL